MYNSPEEVFEIVRNQCFNNNSVEDNEDDGFGRRFCELVFDGIMCWPRTKAGHVAKQLCSNQYVKSTLKGYASRKCTDEGSWYISPETNSTWTDYNPCGTLYIEKAVIYIRNETEVIPMLYKTWIPIIKKITHFGYVTSLVTLLIACLIFIYIKRLHCARNRLHLHLFSSFIMKAIMALMKDGLFVNGVALAADTEYINGEPNFTKENYSWVCKAIVSLKQYFTMANFMLLLMEGTYLHNLMFLNLFSDKNAITLYYTLGWGLPVIFVIPWIFLRAFYDDDVCWTKINNKYINLLIEMPIAASVVINFIFFVIIIRVLCLKLNSMYIQQRRIKYRKLLRSTLILVPLFGMPYTISLILSIDRGASHTLTVVWMFFDQSFAAFQGLFAALVYCLLNSEVQVEIKRKYCSLKERNNKKDFRRSRTISHTLQISMPTNDELDIPMDTIKK